jgi:hypothetical protein
MRSLADVLANPAAMEEMIFEQAELAIAAREHKSPQQKIQEEILQRLDELGGLSVTDESILFIGDKFVLPANFEGNIGGAVKYLKELQENDEQTYDFSRTFNYRPWDGAAAFSRAMQRVFGTSGIGKTIHTFFGSYPPQLRTIPTGLDEHQQVPWGQVKFSQLEATFSLKGTVNEEHGIIFEVSVEAPRKHRRRIDGFLSIVEAELRENSIYRGRMIDASQEMPGFLNAYSVTRDKVVYSREVITELQANVWTVIEKAEYYRSVGLPLKRAVLLEGPYGSGKSLAGVLTAQCAVENGWTFILVRPTDDPYMALKTARLYAPSVVWIEDLDVLVANKSREEITALLDALDSVSTKGAEVIAGYTTNFPGVMDKGVLRPGRLDSVIHVGQLDAAGHERLVKATIPTGILDPETDFTAVAEALDGYLPAFTVEAAQRALRYAVSRSGGEPDSITTEDLVNAANGLRPQFDLASGASEAKHGKPTVDKLLTGKIEEVFSRTEWEGERFKVLPPEGPVAAR